MISGGPGKTGRLSRIIFTAALIGMLFCFMAISAAGSSVLTISARQQLDLADILFEQAEYGSAMAEYRRFAHFFPDHPQADYAGFQIAQSYFLRQDYEKALSLFESIAGLDKDNRYSIEASFMVSRCYLALGRQESAVTVLEALIASVDDIDVRDKACYHIGWIYLEAGSVLDVTAINRAGEYFARISDRNQIDYKVGPLINRLQAVEADRQGPLLSRKNPQLAGALAIFPGAGYVYCGRYHDALISFLLNAGMAYAAYEAFDSDLEALGALISLGGMGFYAGSIYGSVSAAHKYNRTRSRGFLNRLKDVRVDVSPVVKGDGVMVRWHVPF